MKPPLFIRKIHKEHNCVEVWEDGEFPNIVLCEHMTIQTFKKIAELVKRPEIAERL